MTRAGVLLAVDVAVLTVRQGRLGVLAVRDSAPHHPEVADNGREEDRGAAWQLPGAPVPADEDCDAVAEQLLLVGAGAVTGRDTMFLEQLRTYSSPHRVPGARLVSVAYVALVPELVVPSGASAASRVFADLVAAVDPANGERVLGELASAGAIVTRSVHAEP